jgi:hypothetical protein
MRGPSTTSNAGDESAAGVTTRVPELRPANGKCQEGRVRMCTARTRARETHAFGDNRVSESAGARDRVRLLTEAESYATPVIASSLASTAIPSATCR